MHQNAVALALYRKLGFEGHKSSFLSKWIARISPSPREQPELDRSPPRPDDPVKNLAPRLSRGPEILLCFLRSSGATYRFQK